MLPRRNTVRARKTRARILEAALVLFKEKGFEATTIRDIADRSKIAVGSMYYYFETKEQIVFAFYEMTLEGSEKRAIEFNNSTNSFDARIRDILEYKITQLTEYKDFIGQLIISATNPKNPLSPFSEQASEIRNKTIHIFENSIDGSDLRIAKELMLYLPSLLWLFQMAVILFWIYDNSENFLRTKKLISLSIDIISKLFIFTRIPIFRKVNKQILNLLELFSPKTKNIEGSL